MNQEPLTRHLFRYTLETVCKGNRNELARRLEMDPVEVRRLIRRYNRGGGSGMAAEALLRMYYEDPDLSLDEALCTLRKTLSPESSDASSKTDYSVQSMLRKIEFAYREEYLWLQERSDELEIEAKIYQYADDFMKKLRKLFCERIGASGDDCGACIYASASSECPCLHFGKYIEWLRALLTARRSSTFDI